MAYGDERDKLENAAKRFERNNKAADTARLAQDVYNPDNGPPPGWKNISRRQGLARTAASPDAPNATDTSRPAAETLAPTTVVASTGASPTTAGGAERDLAAGSERPAPRRAFGAVAQRLGLRFTASRHDEPGLTLRQLEREPEGSIIARGLNGKFDHVDAFAVGIRDVDQYSIDYLTALVFTSIPWRSRLLFDLRNILVKPLGLAPGRVPVSQDVAPSISFALGEKAIFFSVIDGSMLCR